MKTQFKVGLGLVLVSWLATGAVWLKQRNDQREAERASQQSIRNLQDSSQSQWGGGMRQRWVQVPDAKKKVITASITQQLNAFRQDDYNKAAEFQSSNLRRNFSSTAMFRAIIRRSYPEFADYKSVTFGRARMDPEQKRVAILTIVEGKSGKTSRVIYFMVNENNQYRVDGVARARERGRFTPPAPPTKTPRSGNPGGLPPNAMPPQVAPPGGGPATIVPPGIPPGSRNVNPDAGSNVNPEVQAA